MKRILLLMILALMTVSIWAEKVQINGIYYNLSETAEVTNGDNKYTGIITIPSSVTYGGTIYSVTSIGYNAFGGCSSLTSVSIPSSVINIGDWAFSYCISLTSVTIPNTVNNIGNGAFQNCNKLTSISIPSSLTNIGNQVFQLCSGLTQVSIPNSVVSIGNNAFEGCSKLATLTIPSSVMSIGEYAFGGCSSLTSVSIPNSITEISKSVFKGCSGLLSVTIPNSILSIGESAFMNCTSLASIDIPNSVTSIGKYAFTNCSSITTISIPNSLSTISAWMFSGCSSFASVTIPNSVTSIGYSAFDGCKGLTSVTIPNSVTDIEGMAFWNCNKLTSVNIADLAAWCTIKFSGESSNPLYYAKKLYLNSSQIKKLVIPNSVTTISDYAFAGCTTLTSVTIPNTVSRIGSNAFYKCTGLTAIYISDLSAWNRISFADNPLHYAKRLYLNGEEVKELVIPSSESSISNLAFYGCSSLTSVTIPNSVTNIGRNAFRDCSGLTSVTIARTVTNIGGFAFHNCNNLKDITCLSKDVPNISLDEIPFGSYPSEITLHVLPGYKTAYESYDYWKQLNIVEDAFDPSTRRIITFGASDYSTYCTDANLDFSEVDGLKAYIASSFNPSTGSLTITRVDNVPAGEGMLLKGTAGESYDVPTTDDASVVANLLKGNTTTITLNPTDGDNTNFVLSQNNEGVIGFYRFNNSFSMPANKAWLQIPTNALGGSPAQARGFRFVEEGDELTGISDVVWKSADNNIIYDLQGRRINSQPTRGLYIQNGKKILK